MTAGISVEGLTKTYRSGRVRALESVSLHVTPGEVLGVIGPNGAGKTTLMGCLLGFLNPDSGSVTIEGRAHAWPGGSGRRRAMGRRKRRTPSRTGSFLPSSSSRCSDWPEHAVW